MSQGHIRQQGKKSWEIKFDLGRDPVTGRRITKYVSFRGTKRDAERELTRLLSTRNEGTYVDPTKMSVAEYLRHWLDSDVDRRLAAKTAQRHREICEKNIIPRIGLLPVRKLTPLNIEAMEVDLQKEGRCKGKGGLSAQTVKHVHRTLSQALAHAVRLGVLARNPAQAVRPPKPPEREIMILLKDEIGTLLRSARGTWLYGPVLVAVTTGMRRGEILGLRWRDIDLQSSKLSVQQTAEYVNRELNFKAPKTTGSRRTITLPAITVEALKTHRKAQLEDRMKLGLGRDDKDLVFTNALGEPILPYALTKAFGDLIVGAKVTPITLHGLRHTHISHLLMDGVHVKVVSERAGHANVSITLNIYAAYVPNMQEDAAKAVDATLREALKD